MMSNKTHIIHQIIHRSDTTCGLPRALLTHTYTHIDTHVYTRLYTYAGVCFICEYGVHACCMKTVLRADKYEYL